MEEDGTIEISEASDLPDQEVVDEEILQSEPADDLNYDNMQKDIEKLKTTANIQKIISKKPDATSSQEGSDEFIRNFLLTFIMKKTNIQDYYSFDEKNLGSGTYGVVKKVTHKITKQERAVKIIPRNKIKNMERFKMEVDILRTVDHPNIVKFYEWFEDERNVYLVME